jgi:hypothetical protein
MIKPKFESFKYMKLITELIEEILLRSMFCLRENAGALVYCGPWKFLSDVLMQSSAYFAKWIINIKCPKYITQFLKLEERYATRTCSHAPGSVTSRYKPGCSVSSEQCADRKYFKTLVFCAVILLRLVTGY